MNKKEAAKPSPLPWKSEPEWEDDTLEIYAKDGSCIATIRHPQESSHSREANAALIVRAVNAHSALVSCASVLESISRIKSERGAREYLWKEIHAQVSAALKLAQEVR